jgi:hypothetical protein
VICIATIVGMIMNFTPIDPIQALYWSAVINGVVSVPVMAIMMWLAAAPKVMGEFVVAGWVKRSVGWQPRSWRSRWRRCWRPHKTNHGPAACSGISAGRPRNLERNLETEVGSAL